MSLTSARDQAVAIAREICVQAKAQSIPCRLRSGNRIDRSVPVEMRNIAGADREAPAIWTRETGHVHRSVGVIREGMRQGAGGEVGGGVTSARSVWLRGPWL
jgi:hypothetical protein